MDLPSRLPELLPDVLPGEDAMRAERSAIIATIAALQHEDFERGPTLCEGWAPRDVLAHLVGVDDLRTYLRSGLNVSEGNARTVERWRPAAREELLERARTWAARPAIATRLAAWALLGDVAVHHQDVLRPRGLDYELPAASRAAILREGMLLGGLRLLTHRIEPVDGGRPLGRGRVVRGTSEDLGMWLCGRESATDRLTFVR